MPGTPIKADPHVEEREKKPTEPHGGGGQPQGTGLSTGAPFPVGGSSQEASCSWTGTPLFPAAVWNAKVMKNNEYEYENNAITYRNKFKWGIWGVVF